MSRSRRVALAYAAMFVAIGVLWAVLSAFEPIWRALGLAVFFALGLGSLALAGFYVRILARSWPHNRFLIGFLAAARATLGAGLVALPLTRYVGVGLVLAGCLAPWVLRFVPDRS